MYTLDTHTRTTYLRVWQENMCTPLPIVWGYTAQLALICSTGAHGQRATKWYHSTPSHPAHKTTCITCICDPLWEKVHFRAIIEFLLRAEIRKNSTVLAKLLFVTSENYGVASAFSRWSGVDSPLLALVYSVVSKLWASPPHVLRNWNSARNISQ